MFLNKIVELILNLFYSNNPNSDYKICRRCKTLLRIGVTICPNCGLRQVLPIKLALIIWALTVFAVFAACWFIPKKIMSEYDINSKPQNAYMIQNIEQDSAGTDIPIKPMIKLSGLSVDEILKIRKNAAAGVVALGDISKYQPNPQVFQMEGGLPWIGARELCSKGVDNNPTIGEGESRESLGILNPELLYYVIIPAYGDKNCTNADYLVPHKLVYHKDKNTVVAFIDYKSLAYTRGYFYFHLSDTNARDFNYDWAYADKTYNIKFEADSNFSNHVSQTRGYWHRGSSCGLSSGCNNYSPINEDIILKVEALPAAINIKLWKKEPKSSKKKADINYMMVFE